MKPPDKLYVSQLIYETWQYQTPDPDDETQVEYIRKNALVSTIEKQIKFYENSHPINDYEKGCDAGAVAALKHILESL